MSTSSVLNKRAFSLIEVMVTVAIMSIVLTAFTKWQVTAMKANKSASIRQNIMDIKRTISTSLSCEMTFQSFGPTRPISCTGPVTLKDKAGNSLTNNDKIDDWTIEASCEFLGSPSANGLSIYAAKPDKIDPLRGLALTRDHPVAMLFSPELRLCRDLFKEEPSSDGWVRVIFSSYALPFESQGGDGSYAWNRYGLTSGINNLSPNELCKRNGYDYSSGVCRGTHVTNIRHFSYEGTLLANNGGSMWGYACKYGDPNTYWADENTEILCLKMVK